MRNDRQTRFLREFLVLNLIVLIWGGLYFVNPVLATNNPVVTATNPADKQERVDVNLPINITFDHDMDASTMTSSNIVIRDSKAQNIQARGIHYDAPGKTTVFVPLAPLKQDETYQIMVSAGGVKDINGLPLLQDYLGSFKTTLSAVSPVPLVLETIPQASVSQIGTKRIISASFNHDMDPNTINSMTFTVIDQHNNSISAKSVMYDPSSRIAAFEPASPLALNSHYTVTLKGSGSGIKDSAGINLAKDYTWSFTTGNTELNDPHGNYLTNTNVCATCHQTHNALNTSLLNKSTETAMCFTCHDGSGSNYNVSAGMTDTTNNQSFHPIMDTGNLNEQQLFQCSDCHNPHGDQDAQGNYYDKLLRVTDGTTTVYQGNEFCLICHGANDRQFTATYYANTAGNHSNPIAAHYNTTKSVLDSGTKITCSKCHTPHSGRYNQLTDLQEESLCLTCHADPANSHSGTGNIQEQFFGSSNVTVVSKHDITSSNNGKCTSCHGPHTVGTSSLSEGQAYSDLADPQNTKNVFTTVAGTPNATVGNMTYFCLRCHGGTPPAAARSLTQVVPFTIIFPQATFQNGSGWDKTSYLSTKHAQNGMGCDECHVPHGSRYPSLEKRGEDTASTDGECLTCHADVRSAMNQASHHPTLEISGKHIDTETAASKLDPNNRHASCMDCHDPHSSSVTTKSGNNLCLDCHVQGSTSGFSSSGGQNLHLDTTHSQQSCNACHVTVSHGSPNAKLLSTTATDENSKLISFTGSTNNWSSSSCTTVNGCHTQ
ncbi:Ig-like domain-containing protein [Desulfitobacterium sp. AusDCA]|uniref:Ig-like domain-containing protein n=1 Tax=Desulfitobacterium sp. AusDCA TaxID=3240383 RepID=UPI003DA70481